ncbi:remorin family protein [Striga asiatica]|uniref:Remorin family protein n=1 Tax=Striga asiatica TaxID=4170 RepID=A0A5A7QH91_STRAF|nr:remorin family protein [Striga asiatica]
MESLIKQTRKGSQSWLRRQFSRQTSSDNNDLSGADYQAAVAAAAYAIQSLDDLKSNDNNKEATNKSLSKMKDKAEATITPLEPLKSALKSADETLRSSFKNPNQTSSTNKKTPEKEPSFKKRISFADNDETIIGEKPENSEVGPTFRADSKKKPETIMPKTNSVDLTAVKSGLRDYRADDWEKEEIAKIGERYVKLRATIDNWETKKKKNAKRKIQRAEAELDKKRAKAIQSNRDKITRIEAIARGAREQADENRKKEEFKAKEKANKIRLTGKIPATCFCF